MRILLLGSRGFIGRHLLAALEQAGHEVVRGERPAMDLARDVSPGDWAPRLAGIDLAINAAGAIRDQGEATLRRVHLEGPRALFTACAAAGVAVLQLSALGADEGAATAFHLTKCQADEALLALDVPSLVLQPSLVVGPGGASTRLFAMLASLPWVPLPGRGEQAVQPVHIGDLVAVVIRVIESRHFARERLAVAGPRRLTLREFLSSVRTALGGGRARFIEIPERLVDAAARWGVGLLDADTWTMLKRGNAASADAMTRVLGRAPRDAADALREQAGPLRAEASLGYLLPMMRAALAAVWIGAGIVSIGPYPVEQSYALLARTGITGAWAPVALYGAAALDLFLGMATLFARRRHTLWILQAGVVIAYTAIITVALPEQWLHPYGPVVKNLPILALLAALHQLEHR